MAVEVLRPCTTLKGRGERDESISLVSSLEVSPLSCNQLGLFLRKLGDFPNEGR